MLQQPVLPNDFKLANLYYGHPGKFILSLKGRFDPNKMKVAIFLGQMKCGCWVILDGNNRIGLILKNDPEATIKTIPSQYLLYAFKGTWDETIITFLNPYPKSFGLVMKHTIEINSIKRNKSSFVNEVEYQNAIAVHMNELDKMKHICVK